VGRGAEGGEGVPEGKMSNILNNARKLRKNMTPWERKLWYLFLRDYPVKVYKQKPLGNYILDFYCPSAKVAIELDGSGHYLCGQKQYDEQRTRWLTSKGISVIRINNNDVDRNFKGVKEYIDSILANALRSPSQSAKLPAPPTEGSQE